MSEESSHRQILRSTSIIGGASILNVFIGLLRTKVAALLLGPAGIGLIGLLQNLMSTASAVAALGFGTAGTRQIVEAAGRDDPDALAVARRALFWGTLLLSLVGAIAVWMLREPLAARVLGDPVWANEVGWLALGVFMTVAAGSQVALLNGLRRIGDMARISVSSGVLATVLGIAALLIWGKSGLLAFVLSTPLASLLMGHFYVARAPRIQSEATTSLRQISKQWYVLVRLGSAFMVAGLAATVGQLAVRSMIQHRLGADALGHFQAAWLISMTYIGFVLTAMGTDYYPRLTASIHDQAAVNRMVNEQTEVALLLAGPVFLVMLALAPWVIDLLYSGHFGEAATVLRWQVEGDILKVTSWPLGYLILAHGDGRTFMLSESVTMAVFVMLTWLGLGPLGIQATGIAFLGMYCVYLPLVYGIARSRTGFRWSKRVMVLLFILLVSATCVHFMADWSTLFAAVVGVVAGTAFGWHSFRRLLKLSGSNIKFVEKFQGIVGRAFFRKT